MSRTNRWSKRTATCSVGSGHSGTVSCPSPPTGKVISHTARQSPRERFYTMACGRASPLASCMVRHQRSASALIYRTLIKTYPRALSSSTRLSTDGVFRALTENRVQTPWVEALRKQREQGHDPTQPSDRPTVSADRDLKPRKMSESYHSVVCNYAWPLLRQSD